jgi:hypothetical protein
MTPPISVGKALSFVFDVTERDKCREVAAQIGASTFAAHDTR